MRVIATMTTVPGRIEHIRPAIESVLAQSVPIEHLEVNIPDVCQRTGDNYAVPPWLHSIDRVRVFRTEDYGPITKVAPTFARYRYCPKTLIYSVDDDILYPRNQLKILLSNHNANRYRILVRRGGSLTADGGVMYNYGKMEVDLLAGFGGVLYPAMCTRENFDRYVRVASAEPDSRKSDDLVLSLYFRAQGIPIYLFNPLEDFEPLVSLPHQYDASALHLEGDPLARYKRAFAYLNSSAFRDAMSIS